MARREKRGNTQGGQQKFGVERISFFARVFTQRRFRGVPPQRECINREQLGTKELRKLM